MPNLTALRKLAGLRLKRRNPSRPTWTAALAAVTFGFFTTVASAVTEVALQGADTIATGSNHSCARMANGSLKCWGNGFNGQIGDNGDISKCPGNFTCADVYSRRYPVDVPEQSSGIVKVSAGNGYTCALAAGGAVNCWGLNVTGQVGNGSGVAEHAAPEPVAGIATAVDVSAGLAHACVALSGTDGVRCWGSNDGRQLGDGTSTSSNVPVAVAGLTGGFKAVAAGNYHSCALAEAGDKVWCWGTNNAGQAGANPSQYYTGAIDVVGLPASGIQAIAAGGYHSCALAGGRVYCWGENKKGQLGSTFPAADYFFNAVAIPVPGITGATAIVAGDEHTCAVDAGAVKCWGYNAAGQLGNGTTTDSVAPVVASGLESGVTAIGARCAVLGAGGGVKCWGNGIVGDGLDASAGTRLTPVSVVVPTDYTANAFSFSPATVTGVPVGSVQQSSFANLSGFDDVALVTIVNGEYSQQCSGPFTSRPGNLPIGRGICVRHTAAVTTGETVTTTLTVGGQSATFSSTTTTQGVALTVDKAGGGAGTVTSSPSGIDCGATCSATFTSNETVTLTAAPATGSVFAGWSGGGCSGAGTCTVVMSESRRVTASFAPIATTPTLTASPASLAFGGQSMNTTSPAQAVTLASTGTGSLTVDSLVASSGFGVSHTCGTLPATLPPGASCTASVTFTPAAAPSVALGGGLAVSGTLAIGSSAGSQSVTLGGTAEKSLVTHYYRSILRRAPDAGGKAYWDGEAARVKNLGLNVNEVWFAMAQQFYTSAEYLALGRDNTGFVTDLFNTFFNRAPDQGGLDYWKGQLDQGMPREVVLTAFMFSAEFGNFTGAIFGNATVRAEVNVVTDFYRGLLARLPDDGGFVFWRDKFRAAQCNANPGNAVNAAVEEISSLFANSPEYANRARNPPQYVGDLYNAFLRRGGDLGGVLFWIDEITQNRRSRENVRQAFVASTEFQARVAAVIDQGCGP